MSDVLPLLSPEYAAAPQPFWKKLRETQPVYYAKDYGFWVVSRHADIVAIAKDTDNFSSSGGPAGQMAKSVDSEENAGIGFLPMIQNDPPEHGRLRALFAKAFTPKRIATMEPEIYALARELVEDLRNKNRQGEALDLVRDFASPLPVLVIARMLGIPIDERHKLRVWSESMAIGLGEGYSIKEQSSALASLSRTMADIVSRVRTHPIEDTLLGAMVNAVEQADRLRDDEILGLSKLLWLAGNETTTNLISNGVVFLMENPEVLREIQIDKSRIPDFVEEMLRYNGPVVGLFRNATRDVHFRDKMIRAGESIWLLFASGNLDSDVFESPETFDLNRNNHEQLAFGKGIHFCIGSALAKLEARIAFELLADLLPAIHVDVQGGKRIPVPVLSGWVTLPMKYC